MKLFNFMEEHLEELPYNWSWDFDDDNTSYLQNPTHKYTLAGTYSVKLVVTDCSERTKNVSNDTAIVTITERDTIPPYIKIIKPYSGIYFKNSLLLPFLSRFIDTTIIIHEINITVDTTDENGVEKVEFYIDEEYKATNYHGRHVWTWDELAFFKHTIKVVSYDNAGNTASDEIVVWKFF